MKLAVELDEHVGMQRIAALLEAWLWLDGRQR